jgi:lipopolysaccharide export system protein LptC
MRLGFDDNYSAFVAWLKTLLPIAALGMLSTIFLFSGKIDVTKSLPYAELNVAEIVREQRITKPYFTTISENGTEVALSAAYASVDPNITDIYNVSEPSIVLKSTTGQRSQITAGFGKMNSKSQQAIVSQGVQVTGSPGFWIKTNKLDVNFERATFNSNGLFEGVTPIGTIKAGKMFMQMAADDRQIVFTNGVELIYQPYKN